MSTPKTLGDCWEIFKAHKVPRPEKVLDDSTFPIATELDRLDGLIRSAIANAHHGRDRGVRWGHVARAFAVGSRTAAELCRRYDFNPDEMVGEESGEGDER